VEFDAIWQRHKRMLVRKALAWTVGTLAVIAALIVVWRFNQPYDIKLQLNEASFQNDNLPPLKDAVVTLYFDNETKTDTIHALNDIMVFNNIPHRFLNKPLRVSVTCRDFMSLDTTLPATQSIMINLYRNPTVYGDIHFKLWNPEKEIAESQARLSIAGMETTSDENGNVALFVPLEKQRKSYHIESSLALYSDTIYMPCGENDVVLTR
jgi:hypothetical protein